MLCYVNKLDFSLYYNEFYGGKESYTSIEFLNHFMLLQFIEKQTHLNNRVSLFFFKRKIILLI